MLTMTSVDVTDYRQYALWLVTLVVVAIGSRYVKVAIVFALDKLYQFFIQNNAPGT
jgi:hypothetical protein